MVKGKTNYTLTKRGYHLLIDEVSAWICQQCGEVFFEGEEVNKIQDLVKTLDSKLVKANLARTS